MWFWSVLAAWLSLFSLGLVDNARGPIFPDILKDFALTDTRGSFFFLTSSCASLLHNMLGHAWLSKASPVRLIGIYSICMGVGAFLISQAQSFEMMLVAASLLGIGFGGLGVGQNAAVQAAPPLYRARSMGLLHAMYGVSSLLAPLCIASFAAEGWRRVLAFLSLPGVLVGGWVLVRDWRQAGAVVDPPKSVEPTVTPPSRQQWPEVWLRRTFESSRDWPKKIRRGAWLAGLLVGCLVVAEISISSRMALLARRDWGFSSEDVGWAIAGYFAAMTVSRLSLGVFRFPLEARKLLYASILMGIPFLLLAFLPLGLPKEVRLLALVGFGFPIAMGYPLAMTRLAELFGARTQNVTALCMILQSAAAMTMHFSLGWGADLQGLNFVLAWVSMAALIGAFVAFRYLERTVSSPEIGSR